MQTTEFDPQLISDELLNYLRNILNDYDPKQRVVVKTKTLTTTQDVIYFVSNKLNFIKSITYDGNILSLNKHYKIHWRKGNKGSVELYNVDENKTLIIEYGEQKNTTSFVYPDLPLTSIGLTSYPRVGFKITYSRSVVGGDGNRLAFNNSGQLQIKIVSEVKTEINEIAKIIDDFIFYNPKIYYYIRYISPSSISDYDNFSDNTDKPFYKMLEYELPHKYQI